MPVPESSETNGQMREMVEADLPLVLHWRNQADVRRFMYTHHEISEAEHSEWFEAATADSRRHLLIFEMNKQALGFQFQGTRNIAGCELGLLPVIWQPARAGS